MKSGQGTDQNGLKNSSRSEVKENIVTNSLKQIFPCWLLTHIYTYTHTYTHAHTHTVRAHHT